MTQPDKVNEQRHSCAQDNSTEFDTVPAAPPSGFLADDVWQVIAKGSGSTNGLDSKSSELVSLAGQQFGCYLLTELIGEGGFGFVYRAENPTATTVRLKHVAIKVMRSLASPSLCRVWQSEIDALRSLSHPGIVSYFDSGITASGVAWLAMELVEGKPIHQAVPEPNSDWRTTAHMLVQACAAIEYAHGFGILHRDLKPSNILVRGDGTPVIVDFGLVQFLTTDAGQSVSLGAAGTPSYMAPEQILRYFSSDRSPLTPAVDVFGLGATLYCLLSGRPPRGRTFPMSALAQTLASEPVRRLSRNDTEAPSTLLNVVDKALQFDVSQRYATAAEFREDLEAVLDHRPTKARPLGLMRRIVLFARRHPVSSMLSAFAVMLLVVLASTLIYAATLQSQRNQQQAYNRQLAARVQQEINDLYQEATQLPNVTPGVLKELREEFDALSARTTEATATSQSISYCAAVAEYILAEYLNLADRKQEANDHLVALIPQYERLRAQGFRTERVTFDLFHAYNKLGYIQFGRHDFETADRTFLLAETEIMKLCQPDCDNLDYWDCLAQSQRSRGMVAARRDNIAFAIEMASRALVTAKRTQLIKPDEPRLLKHAAGALADMGRYYGLLDNLQKADDCFQQAVVLAKEMVDHSDRDPFLVYELAEIQNQSVACTIRLGDFEHAAAVINELEDESEYMINERPDVTAFVQTRHIIDVRRKDLEDALRGLPAAVGHSQ